MGPVPTLVILRHAKAADPAGGPDVARPLTDRGQADAAAAGAWLADYPPDLVLCSPATRTRQTWHGVALGLAAAPEVRYERSIYNAAPEELLTLLQSAEDVVGTLLLIGHNPGLSQLSVLLDPARDDSAALRTAGVAVHHFDGEWARLAPGAAPLVAAHTPRGSGPPISRPAAAE